MAPSSGIVARMVLLLLIAGAAALLAHEIVVARRNPAGYWTTARKAAWSVIALLVIWLRGPLFVQTLMPPERVLVDFFQEWSSVQNWRRGLPIYEHQVQAAARYLGFSFDPREEFAVEFNAHPPPAVLFAIPLVWLSYPHATLAWNLLSLLLGAAALWVINRELKLACSWRPLLALVPLALLFDPLISQTFFAQLNLFLLFLIVGAWSAMRQNREVLAGVCLGTAAAVKLFPGLLFLYFLLQRRWVTLAAGVLTACGWFCMTLLLFGLDAHIDYIAHVLPKVQEWRSALPNMSIQGWWARLFYPGTKGGLVQPLAYWPAFGRVGALVSSLGLVIGAASILWRTRDLRCRELGLASMTVTMLLVSPTCWEHYLLLLLLPFAQAWRFDGNHARFVRAGSLLLTPVWLQFDVINWLVTGHLVLPRPVSPIVSLLALSLKTYILLGFWVYIGLLALKE